MEKNVLAVDFGGSNGRVILGAYINGELSLKEIHRFPNIPIEKEGTLYWDFPTLCQEMLVGIKQATDEVAIDSIAIDTWGVDYGLLNQEGQLLSWPIHYRDQRTAGQMMKVEEKISQAELYLATGNQIMEINTLFQLLAEKELSAKLNNAEKLLFMPDLFSHYLTGSQKTEMTIASTSQLMNPLTSDWNWDIINLFDLPKRLFPEIIEQGEVLGLTKKEHGVPQIPVLSIASHDTASAVASVPSEHQFLFISCGTWSLVGTELAKPILNNKALNYNLTNEKGVNNTTRFLKNITGLWILQEVKREFEQENKKYSYQELEELAYASPQMKCLIDTDDPLFTPPGKMIERIQEYARDTNQAVPMTDGELIRCVYESLAFKYKYTFLEIIDAVGHEFDSINIVGGGSNSKILCEMVASAANMTVYAGPNEATAIGNINVQLLYHGALNSLEEARVKLRTSPYVTKYPAIKDMAWDQEFGRYQKLLKESR